MPLTPRRVLLQARDRLRALGYEPYVASEFEFYVSEGTPETLRQSGWELKPLSSRAYTYQCSAHLSIRTFWPGGGGICRMQVSTLRR